MAAIAQFRGFGSLWGLEQLASPMVPTDRLPEISQAASDLYDPSRDAWGNPRLEPPVGALWADAELVETRETMPKGTPPSGSKAPGWLMPVGIGVAVLGFGGVAMALSRGGK